MNKAQRLDLKLTELTTRFEDDDAEWYLTFQDLVAWHEDLCTWKGRSKVFNSDGFHQRFKKMQIAAGKNVGAIPWDLYNWSEMAANRKEVKNATLLRGQPEYVLSGMSQNPMLPFWHDAANPSFEETIRKSIQLAFIDTGRTCFNRFRRTEERWPEIREHLLMMGIKGSDAPDMTVLWDFRFHWGVLLTVCRSGRAIDVAAFLDVVAQIMMIPKMDRCQHLFRHILPEPPDFSYDELYRNL